MLDWPTVMLIWADWPDCPQCQCQSQRTALQMSTIEVTLGGLGSLIVLPNLVGFVLMLLPCRSQAWHFHVPPSTSSGKAPLSPSPFAVTLGLGPHLLGGVPDSRWSYHAALFYLYKSARGQHSSSSE